MVSHHTYEPNSTFIKTIEKGKTIFFLRNRSRQRCQLNLSGLGRFF
jgi:hypothetical protein